jgi:hypothetical protein
VKTPTAIPEDEVLQKITRGLPNKILLELRLHYPPEAGDQDSA